jgi:polygalacturonase
MKKSFGILLIAINICFVSHASNVVTWPAPEGQAPSSEYAINVEGKNVFVYQSDIAAFATFDFNGKIEVTIKTKQDIKWVDIKPSHLGIKATWKDSIIHFTLTKPCNISIELNGLPKNNPLFLFTNEPEKNIPKSSDKNVIFFEGGKVHHPGMIEVKSGQTIYIAGGAVVEGAIRANDASDIKIMGRGVLNGTRNAELIKERHRFIFLKDCKQIQISGIIMEDSHTWQLVPMHCKNIEINGIKIISNNGGDDGIDLARSSNVNIRNCFIHTKDDCIAIKSIGKYPKYERTENIDVSNCVLWNAAWGNGFEIGFELLSDSVNNIKFTNSDIIHVEDGAALSIHNGDCSTVNNILFDSLRIENTTQKFVDLAVFYTQYSSDKPKDKKSIDSLYLHGAWDGVLKLNPTEKQKHAVYRGQIKNVVFRNIDISGEFPFSLINGYDNEHNIENVTFENININGKKVSNALECKLYTEFANNIRFK